MLIGYSRVSTVNQTTEPQDIKLRCAGCEKIFSDIITGKTFSRPGLDEMLTFARPHDVVVVVRLDRLGRSLRDLLNIIEVMKERGIGFRSLEENLDTTSPAGSLVLHIFGSLSEFERQLISQRTKDGLEAAKARGAVVGRPPVSRERIAEACQLISAGHSLLEVAKTVGIGVSTLYRYIKS